VLNLASFVSVYMQTHLYVVCNTGSRCLCRSCFPEEISVTQKDINQV